MRSFYCNAYQSLQERMNPTMPLQMVIPVFYRLQAVEGYKYVFSLTNGIALKNICFVEKNFYPALTRDGIFFRNLPPFFKSLPAFVRGVRPFFTRMDVAFKGLPLFFKRKVIIRKRSEGILHTNGSSLQKFATILQRFASILKRFSAGVMRVSQLV